jgi:hypothetical protein
MEYALAEKAIYLPPLLIAGLLALYRKNILCFWDCHPVGVAVKQFQGEVIELAKSTGIILRNFPTAVAAKISTSTDLMLHLLHRSALMILTSIQGILVTIKQSLSLIVYQVTSFLRHIFTIISNYTAYIQNTTVDLFRSVPKPSNHFYSGFLVIATILCIGLILYHQTNKKVPTEPVVEPVVEDKKPVRRRSKKNA